MACVDVAAFPLQLLLRDHPDWKDHPAAVVDQDKAQGTILWVNHRARALRILPGMRHGAGLALSRHLRAGVISHAAIEKAVDALVPRLRRFAAEVEPSRDEPGVFWLGASGLSLLHPRLEEWAGLIHGDLDDAGLHNTVAVGFSRFGSYAAAKACDRIVVFHTPEEEHDHVRGVVLERLDFAPKVRDLLARLGIHTLGGFLDLLRLRMEAAALTAGVTEIVMEVWGVSPDIRQGELFHGASARDHDAANRALARLRARFGDDALLRARSRPGHLPEARFTWEPMEAVPPPRPRRVLLRPLVRRFFPKPVRLLYTEVPAGDSEPKVHELQFKDPQVADSRADDTSLIRESAGPYIISGGWWGSGAEVHREYRFVRTGEGPWLWIYYDRKRRGWFLHGKVE